MVCGRDAMGAGGHISAWQSRDLEQALVLSRSGSSFTLVLNGPGRVEQEIH